MMNPFAAKQSGVASLIESMIPAEIMDSIKSVTNQLPAILDKVQTEVSEIRATQQRIENQGIMILAALEEMRCKVNPDAVPRLSPLLASMLSELPTAPAPSPTGTGLALESESAKCLEMQSQ
jgi:hypothetical protein